MAAAHERAEAQYRWAGGAVEQLLDDLGDWSRTRPDDLRDARQRLLQRALVIQQEFLDRHGAAPAVELDLARTHVRIALLKQALGDGPGADAAYQQAQALVEEQLRRRPDDRRAREQAAATLSHGGQYWRGRGRTDEAIRCFVRAADLYRGLASASPAEPSFARLHAQAVAHQGGCLVDAKDLSAAEARLGEAIALFAALPPASDATERGQHLVQTAECHFQLGLALRHLGRPAEAADALRAAADLQQRLTAENPRHVSNTERLANTQAILGDVYLGLSEQVRAADAYRVAVAMWQRLVNVYPHDARYRAAVAAVQINLANTLNKLGTAPEEVDRLVPLAVAHARFALTQEHTRAGFGSIFQAALACQGNVAVGRKQHALVAATADQIVAGPPLGKGEEAVRAALYLGTAAQLVRQDPKLSAERRAERSGQYDDRAVRHLRTAVERGFSDAARLRAVPQLKSLQDRDDYRQLLAEVEAKAGAK
jgi:tetratricopeptide (TPR) repeat protein